jgi:hypothetical protein
MDLSDLHRRSRETRPSVGRTYGYVRASNVEEVESPEAQAEIIATLSPDRPAVG